MSEGWTEAASARYALVRNWLLADTPPPARVVELGAAPGQQAVGFAEAGYEVTAVDIGVASDGWDRAPAGSMKARFKAAGVNLVLWDLEQTPYPLPDCSFDVVVMTEIFEHLREYPIKSLHEARRILRPGGTLYFTTPNAAYLGNRLRLAAGRSVMSPLSDWIGGVPHARHAREYTFAEARELMRQAGLEPIRVTSRHFYIQSGRTSRLARGAKRTMDVVARIRPTMGPALVIVARRPP